MSRNGGVNLPIRLPFAAFSLCSPYPSPAPPAGRAIRIYGDIRNMQPKYILRLLATLALAPAICHGERTQPGLHALLSGGLTFGGDTVATAVFENGNKVDIKAGQLVQVGGGILWQSAPAPLALLISANYQIDGTSAKNGKAQFTRVPYELIAYFTGFERLRIGAGARQVQSAKVVYKVNDGEDSLTFKDTTGALVEIGYQLTQNAWLNVRGVSEKYRPATYRNALGAIVPGSVNKDYDGSHIGVNLQLEF